jgi:hypothetical protein
MNNKNKKSIILLHHTAVHDLAHHGCQAHFGLDTGWHNVLSHHTARHIFSHSVGCSDASGITLKHVTSSKLRRVKAAPPGGPANPAAAGVGRSIITSAYRPYPGGGGPSSRLEGSGGLYSASVGRDGFGLRKV